MLPILRDLPVVHQGADWSWRFQVIDGNGDPLDVTDATIRLQIRVCPDGALLAEPTITKVNAADGICLASLHRDDTALMRWDLGVYDVEVTESGGNRFAAYVGEAVMRLRVTFAE